MIKILQRLFDFILPKRCLLCGKIMPYSNSLCTECFDKIKFISVPYCQHCGKSLVGENIDGLFCSQCLSKKDPFRLCRSAIIYDNDSKKLLLDFKFADHIENKKILSQWLYIAGKDIFKEGADAIIPVPLHYSRLFQRKYNQSAILAAELSKIVNLPVYYKVLKKAKSTLPQVQCNAKQRHKNVRGVFKVTHADGIKNKRIILIDDVYTTGSTMRECAKALKKAGAKSVDVLTIART